MALRCTISFRTFDGYLFSSDVNDMKFIKFLQLNVPLGLSLAALKLFRSLSDEIFEKKSLSFYSVGIETCLMLFFVRFFSRLGKQPFFSLNLDNRSFHIRLPDMLPPYFKPFQVLVHSILKRCGILNKQLDQNLLFDSGFPTALLFFPILRYGLNSLVDSFDWPSDPSPFYGFCEKNMIQINRGFITPTHECLDLNENELILWLYDIFVPIILMSINRMSDFGYNMIDPYFLNDMNNDELGIVYQGNLMSRYNRWQLLSVFNGGVLTFFYSSLKFIDSISTLRGNSDSFMDKFFNFFGFRNILSLSYAFLTYFISKSMLPLREHKYLIYARHTSNIGDIYFEPYSNVKFLDDRQIKELPLISLTTSLFMVFLNFSFDQACFVEHSHNESVKSGEFSFCPSKEHEVISIYALYFSLLAGIFLLDLIVYRFDRIHCSLNEFSNT